MAQGFFWIQDKDLADKRKPGIDNLAKAIGLDAKDGSGWDAVDGFASDPTGADLPEHKGVICSPADPNIDPKAFQALAEATQTDPSEWGYPLKDGIEVHAAAQAEFAGRSKSSALIWCACCPTPRRRAMPASRSSCMSPRRRANRAISPSMRSAPLGGDEMCYTKDAGGWKIAGYLRRRFPVAHRYAARL